MHVSLEHGEELAVEDIGLPFVPASPSRGHRCVKEFLTDLREMSDYGDVARVSQRDARRAVEAAQRMIAASHEKLSSLD